MMRRVIVTGGAGFIGSHLTHRLLTSADEVVAVDDLSTGSADNLDPAVALVRGDIRDEALMDRVAQGADCIYHLAASVSVAASIADWRRAHEINLTGTLGVFHAAARHGVPVVYASSAAVYGNHPEPCDETARPLPISPYGADKLGCEHHAGAMAVVHGLRSIGLRFFNVYGPGQGRGSPYSGVISLFLRNRLADRPHVVFGDGRQSRDFVHVSDVVNGLVRAGDRLRCAGSPMAEVFNICSGNGTDILTLAAMLDRVSNGPAIDPVHRPANPGDIRFSQGIFRAAEAAFGYRPETALADGLAELWRLESGRSAPSPNGSTG